jgi:ribosomal-protein-alanine N-acetyltransferase
VIVIPTPRLAKSADAQGIAEMSREYIEHGLGWSWTPARVLHAIHDKSTNVAVIHAQGCVIGFGIMLYGEQTAHLALLAIHPTQRQHGLATCLLAWLETCADTAGLERIHVEARSDNPAALAFYQKQGYKQIGTMPGYYSGMLDAIRFEKRLWTQSESHKQDF